jgi:hypothetical protein
MGKTSCILRRELHFGYDSIHLEHHLIRTHSIVPIMSFRTSARTLAPFFKQALRPQPLASTSRLSTLAPSSNTTSLPYAQFARRFKSTSTSTSASSSAESSTEEGTSTNLKFVDENGNPLRIEPKLQVVPSSSRPLHHAVYSSLTLFLLTEC